MMVCTKIDALQNGTDLIFLTHSGNQMYIINGCGALETVNFQIRFGAQSEHYRIRILFFFLLITNVHKLAQYRGNTIN